MLGHRKHWDVYDRDNLPEEEHELLLNDSSVGGGTKGQRAVTQFRTRGASYVCRCLIIIVIISSFFLGTLFGSIGIDSREGGGINGVERGTSGFEYVPPSLKLLYDQKAKWRGFNVTLGPGSSPSIFRERPGKPDTEAAWNRLIITGLFLLTEEDVRRLGRNPKELVRVPDGWGYGEHVYFASFDHTHQIHCLNELRHAAFFNWKKGHFYAHDFMHLEHCIQSILEVLRCHPDPVPHLYVWNEGQDWPWHDPYTQRLCMDDDPIYEYAREHRVDRDARVMFMPPPEDAIWFPMDPALRNISDILDDAHRDEVEAMKTDAKLKFDEAMRRWNETGKIPYLDHNNEFL